MDERPLSKNDNEGSSAMGGQLSGGGGSCCKTLVGVYLIGSEYRGGVESDKIDSGGNSSLLIQC